MKRIISLLLVLALLTGNLAPAAAVEMQETTAPTEETAVETTEVTVPTEEETEPTETTTATEPETVETTAPTEPEQVELEETAEAKRVTILESGNCGQNATWTLDDSGTLTISGEGSTADYQNWAYWSDVEMPVPIERIVVCDGITRIGRNTFAYCDDATSVTIPDTVTSIGDYAFRGCSSLISISISENVTSIGYSAFLSCDALSEIRVAEGNSSYTSDASGALYDKEMTTLISCPGAYKGDYVVPDGVKTISTDAFFECAGLVSLTIPKSVTNLDEDMFIYCSSLTKFKVSEENLNYASDDSGVLFNKEMTTLFCCPKGYAGEYTVPDTVTSIDRKAFFSCTKVTKLTMQEGVTSIGTYAFFCGYSLTSVTIPSSVKNIDDYAFYECNVLSDVYYLGEESQWKSITIGSRNEALLNANRHYVTGPVVHSPLVLSDQLFHYHSTVEEKQVYYTMDYDENWFYQPSTTYNHELAQASIRMALAAARTSSVSIEHMFTSLAFDNTEYHTPSPTIDTIGYSIGSKVIKNDDGNQITLVAVAVRGGGYKAEWGSNFVVGNGTEHDGFRSAADQVINAVKNHLSRTGATKNVKIWITGYSRAAATANIAAHYLTMEAKNGWISGLEADDIFAYCFECPAGVRKDHGSYIPIDENIFNIVNPVDFVPMVTPSGWNFRRYGITYYLPSAELTYKGYVDGIKKVRDAYSDILEMAGSTKSAKKLSTPAMGQNASLESLLEMLTKIGQDEYYVWMQDAVSQAFAKQGVEYSAGAALVLFLDALLGSAAAVNPSIVAQLLSKVAVVGVISSQIGEAHYPELCLAWMDATTGTELLEPDDLRIRYLTLNCPVDIAVYDSAGILVAQISGDTPQAIEGSEIQAFVDENGQKVVVLPFDEEFTIEVTATDNGTMSYQIQEYDMDTGDSTRVINYYDIPIEEGDILTGTAASSDGSAAEYTLLNPDDQEITPSNALTASEIGNYTVTISALGNGTVAGGGLYVTGEFAKLMAEAEEGENFLGWYEGDTLLSADAEYRFRVEADRQIVGKFTKNTNGDLNGDGLTDAQDVTHLVWHLLFSETFPLTNDADFDCDGDVDLADAADLLWRVLFPVTQ